MPGRKNLDDAAKNLTEGLEKMLAGQPESAIAKVFIVTLAMISASPWVTILEPLVQRVLERINNKVGKDAVAAIAKEVETEEGLRRIASEVSTYLGGTLRGLFEEHGAIGSVQLESMAEITKSTVAESVAQIGILLHRMEERMSSQTGSDDSHRPLATAPYLRGSTTTMKGVVLPERASFEARAFPFGLDPKLHFDLTNVSKFDVRVGELFLDVEYREIEVIDLWEWVGATRPIRRYSCEIAPRTGRYPCRLLEARPDEYLALSSGELESFTVEIHVDPERQGLYRTTVAVECSTAGEMFVQTVGSAVEFVTYDPQQHKPVLDGRMWTAPPDWPAWGS